MIKKMLKKFQFEYLSHRFSVLFYIGHVHSQNISVILWIFPVLQKQQQTKKQENICKFKCIETNNRFFRVNLNNGYWTGIIMIPLRYKNL